MTPSVRVVLVLFSLAVFLVPGHSSAGAQGGPVTPAPAGQTRLRIHVEACDCFAEFLRTEIRWVDFVRQQQDADVQVLSTSRTTGAGGVETVLRFIGAGRFSGVDHELRAVTPPGEPEDVRRRDVLRTGPGGAPWVLGS